MESLTELERNSQYYDSYTTEQKAIAKPPQYLMRYEEHLNGLFDEKLSILELGVFKGNSLELFSQMFPNSHIFGVDINKCEKTFSNNRVMVYQGSQDDPSIHRRIMTENNITRFDIIVDDCSHIGSLTFDSFCLLFPILADGGYYVIEDWGTGYWPKWPGGSKFKLQNHLKCTRETFKSHKHGIPGFIKQLVDEVGMGDIGGSRGLKSGVSSKIKALHVYSGIVFMQKTSKTKVDTD